MLNNVHLQGQSKVRNKVQKLSVEASWSCSTEELEPSKEGERTPHCTGGMLIATRWWTLPVKRNCCKGLDADLGSTIAN